MNLLEIKSQEESQIRSADLVDEVNAIRASRDRVRRHGKRVWHARRRSRRRVPVYDVPHEHDTFVADIDPDMDMVQTDLEDMAKSSESHKLTGSTRAWHAYDEYKAE